MLLFSIMQLLEYVMWASPERSRSILGIRSCLVTIRNLYWSCAENEVYMTSGGCSNKINICENVSELWCLSLLVIFFYRYISTVWQGVRLWCIGGLSADFVVYMDHDISMLRLIKTFCEGTPQLILMIYILLHDGHVGTFQCK